ncbi:hypothetical protein GCM10011579_077220 [Streptomyces albiflavescens]|uniref:TPM domain-containing protein n=1 Tax=Streptomyces albiflavescens TaxID=1623582 RepID=A0A918D8G3_9ACTN|nr:hypothetical protein [Streptomyces albiflavescens]GGN85952.1 hypothetical protein GCM10011579_077220 [Streptomyces albiflavescens]
MGVTRALLALFALSALFATATPANAAGSPTPSTQAAYFAAHLRTNPVYVTDQLPREIPRSQAPAFAELAKRTGIPTYVLVLPEQDPGGKGLLGAVHDRLGRDGLYVLVDTSGVTDAVAYGVRAPADDAATVALYELPYDAGPLRSFERFVDVVAQGSEKAAERAEAAREKYGEGNAEPDRMYIDRTDRKNQSFLTGVLLVGLPLLILLLVTYVRRWRHVLLKATGQAKPDRRRAPEWLASVLALVTAAAIVLTTAFAFDQAESSAAAPPTAADLSSRVERVAAGLKQDSVYMDPESPRVLDSPQLSRLHQRMREFARTDGRGPVYVLLVPQLSVDESAGRPEAFADAVHAELGKDGEGSNDREEGLYVVADTLRGDINVLNYGLRLDSGRLSFDLPESIGFGDETAREADDHLLGERLDDLMTFLDKSPRTDEPSTTSDLSTKAEPIEDNALPPLFSGDFWPGLLVGGLGALLVLGLVTGVLGIVGSVLRRRHPVPSGSKSAYLQEPTDPSVSYLRTTAYDELGALSEEFLDSDDADAGNLTSRVRVWDSFDAAMLLVDGDRDRLTETSHADDADDADGADAPDIDPVTLVTVIVLARAGRAALRNEAYDLCCALNPLHGPAVTRHPVRVSAEDRRRRRLPVCDACRATAIREPGAVHTLLMTLPAQDASADGRGRVPYDVLESPLSAAPDGIPRLIDAVRELAGVE